LTFPIKKWAAAAALAAAGEFDPERFEDHYEEALTELINAKRNGKTIAARPRPRGENVVDLMDALSAASVGKQQRRQRNHARRWPVKRKCYCLSPARKRARKLQRKPPSRNVGRPDRRIIAVFGRQYHGPIKRPRPVQTNSPLSHVRLLLFGTKGNEMRFALTALIALTVVYFCDAEYNQGRLLDGVQSISAAMPRSRRPAD
jgi:hypothetical protein